VLDALRKLKPRADYAHLTLVGHSNGGDTAMYFALQHSEQVSKVITLDNLRVPFVLHHKLKILSFRSKDPRVVTDPGVLPTPDQAKGEALHIIQTPFQHTWMSDRGPEIAKERIQTTGRFLEGSSVTELAAVENDSQRFANAGEALP
jgi:pimeloyl-ACP methyl ester carboxylesterase